MTDDVNTVISRQHINTICNDGNVLSSRVYGPVGAPRLIISHGNGFASDGYQVYWKSLINDFEVVVFDLRGHGQSESISLDRHTWPQMVDDYEALYSSINASLGPQFTVGAFHSLSSVAALGHLGKYGKRIDGLILFDPPLTTPDGNPLQALHFKDAFGLAERVKNRRQYFENTTQLAQQFTKAPAFQHWDLRAYQDMASAVLKKSLQQGYPWELSCPPMFESQMYATNTSQEYWFFLQNALIPIKLVCGDPYSIDPQPGALIGKHASEVFDIDYEYVPNASHFLQLEFPEKCQEITRSFVQRCYQNSLKTNI
jgi:pimeloyl-ACP methyl ester carboxylesterase